jgi:hypothetical protein
MLQVVLYGCETRSVTLREEYALKIFENNGLKKVFGRKSKKVIESQGTFRNEGHP